MSVASAYVPVVPSRVHRLLRRRIKAAIGVVVFVGVVAVWAVFLRPQFLGGPATYVVVSGESMVPTFADGDLVLALRGDTYEVGEIVAFRIPDGEVGAGSIVIHRIVGGSAIEGYVLQGDNRAGPDLWHPRPEDVVGKSVLHLPTGGRLLVVVRSPLVMAILAGLVGFWIAWSLLPDRIQSAGGSGRDHGYDMWR